MTFCKQESRGAVQHIHTLIRTFCVIVVSSNVENLPFDSYIRGAVRIGAYPIVSWSARADCFLGYGLVGEVFQP